MLPKLAHAQRDNAIPTQTARWAENHLPHPRQEGFPTPENPNVNAAPTMPARSRLALRVRLLRAARGWSQERLAAESGLHRNYIGHIERAELNAGLDNIEKIALAFGLTPCALLSPHLAHPDGPASAG